MKRKLKGCFILFIVIPSLLLLVYWLIAVGSQVKPEKVESTKTPTTVVIVNEIYYNFPVVGVIDYHIPGSLNIRSNPDFENSSRIAVAYDGDEFLLLGITEDGIFFITEYESQTVFISVKAITIQE